MDHEFSLFYSFYSLLFFPTYFQSCKKRSNLDIIFFCHMELKLFSFHWKWMAIKLRCKNNVRCWHGYYSHNHGKLSNIWKEVSLQKLYISKPLKKDFIFKWVWNDLIYVY